MHESTKEIIKLCGICESEIHIANPVHPYRTVICPHCNAHYIPEEITSVNRGIMMRRLFWYVELACIGSSTFAIINFFPEIRENFALLALLILGLGIIFIAIKRVLFGKEPPPEYQFKLIATPKEMPKSWQRKESWAVLGSLLFTASLLGVLFLFVL